MALWLALGLGAPGAPAATYYVTTSGNNANPGTSEALAWRTISNAAARAVAGDTVHIRAGNYGAEQVVFANNGAAALPIVFEGYRLAPGDNPPMTNAWNSEPDPAYLPLLDGGNRAAGTALQLGQRQFVTVRNLQIRNYQTGLSAFGASRLTLEHLFAKTFGDLNAEYSGVGISLGSSGHSNTVRNCTLVNASAEGLTVHGNRNHVENVRVYCNEGASVNAATDYYLVVVGNDNVVTNCSVERIGDLPHGGHGIGVKGDGRGNVFSRCTATNLRNGGLYVRHRGAVSNVFDSCEVYGGNGITLRDGASTNVFRNCSTFGAESAIWFFDTTEDGGAQYCGRGNVIENGLFSGTTGPVVWFNSYDVASPADGNRIVNCTIYGGARLFQCDRENFDNRMENSLVVAVTNFTAGTYPPQVSFRFCRFRANGFAAPAGTAILTADPLFAEPAAAHFHLRSGYGRWNPAAGAWTNDLSTRPAIDAGGSYSPEAFADLERPEAAEPAGGTPASGFRAYRVRTLPASD